MAYRWNLISWAKLYFLLQVPTKRIVDSLITNESCLYDGIDLYLKSNLSRQKLQNSFRNAQKKLKELLKYEVYLLPVLWQVEVRLSKVQFWKGFRSCVLPCFSATSTDDGMGTVTGGEVIIAATADPQCPVDADTRETGWGDIFRTLSSVAVHH